MIFRGRTFYSKIEILESILDTLCLKHTIDFVKMDIEGYEVDVLSKSIDMIRQADVITIELHNSKEKVDDILIPQGFTFKPITTSYCISKMIRNSWLHPGIFFTAVHNTLASNPRLLYKLFIGYNMDKNKSNIKIGSYIKGR
jgi:hypothetical protein